MENKLKLYMVLLGCTPQGRVTEQHDVFFGIGENLVDLVPQMNRFWPEANGKLHIDAWREITIVGSFSVEVIDKEDVEVQEPHLYFLNLGGYKPGEFEEYHYKIVTVADDMASAIKEAKRTTFYKHCGFKGAVSHIDDKYGIDVDDFHKVNDLLNADTKAKYQLKIKALTDLVPEDELHIGYVKIKSL